ncbi:MAG: DUF4982 domain-containing protein [Tannerellaceae bacterium]|nr:DUF4982 domain-containing protein [Tannerellaceae bacterium]
MSLKKQSALLLLLCMAGGLTSLHAQLSFGKAERINENWQFSLADEPQAKQPSFEASQWRRLDLPHDWSIEAPLSPSLAACTGYLPGGIAWYRKTILLPAATQGEKVYLYFEGVYNRSEVFLNGHSLGKRPNGYVSFAYDATPYLRPGQDNLIAVRVDHSQSADSRWYTGSGIYRDVWLVRAHPIHLSPWGVFFRTQSLSGSKATLAVETEIENGAAQEASLSILQQLFDAEGKEVARSTRKTTLAAGAKDKLQQEFILNRPHLWSINQPYLYRLKTSLICNKQTIDESTMPVGIRSFGFDANKGFALNGENLKMKGVCLHHDAGALGAAVPRAVWERRLRALKEIGCNAIRMTHNAHAPLLYELCDELGLLVLNEVFDEWEFPKRKWLQGWNVGTPGFQGTYDFFEEWGERDLADVVRRDRNHASVFGWSIGNEVDYPNDPYSHPVLDGSSISQPMFGGYHPEQPSAERLGAIAQRLVKVVKTYDPWRPVTAGLAGVAMSNATDYPFALDLAGYNYTEDRYETDHQTYPARIIYGSENRHDMAAWKAVRDKAHIFGQFLWTGIDYLGEAGVWPARGSSAGLLNLGGDVKPRGYFRQALWADKPMIYAGAYPAPERERAPSTEAPPVWNYEKGQSIRVVVYTNAAKARIELNGRPVGEVKEQNDQTGVISWDLPFESGKLEAIGLDAEGRETARYAIHTSERPYALKATLLEPRPAAAGGLAQISVEVVDENGLPVILADNEVRCTLEGEAKLLGLESSNNRDMTNYRDPVHRVYNGRLIAYVQKAAGAGKLRVLFSSPWLREAALDL